MSTLCLKTITFSSIFKQKTNLLGTLQEETSTLEVITSLFTITAIHKIQLSNKSSFFFFFSSSASISVSLLLLLFAKKTTVFSDQHSPQKHITDFNLYPQIKGDD